MKHILTLGILLALFTPENLWAEGPWGLGVIIAAPTGFSAKYRMDKEHSVDAALGYSFEHTDNITIHSTYLWETNEGIPLDKTHLGYYFGLGGAFHHRDRYHAPPRWAEDYRNDVIGLAIRGVAGLNHYFKKPAIEVFAELSMSFFIVPSTDIDLDLGIGGRFYF